MAEQNLKPCPFCGKMVTVITDAHDLEECSNFESKNCPCSEYELNSCAYNTVVCSVTDGGCGASSGYYPTIGQAIEAWNKRTDNSANVRRGKWVNDICSVCERVNPTITEDFCGNYISKPLAYCPHCGADMRSDEE